jgi:peptide/nickel transport system ATP-binding protein
VELLDVEGLTVTADISGSSIEVLRGISFSLQPGRVVAFVGESGAGKSMITRSIAQLLPAGFIITAGQIVFDGQELRSSPGRSNALLGRDIAFVPQEPMTALDPVVTIGAQFDEHLRTVGRLSAAERKALIIELLASVHLPRPAMLLAHYPHELSGGMVQRVLIAMAFASQPRMIVADEPTTALDVTIQARIVRLMLKMCETQRTAMLFVTHDLRLAAQIADQILVIYAGRIVERGAAADVFSRPRHPYTRSLLLANPPVSGPDRALLVMPDRMPGLQALATIRGCPFAPRCAVSTDDCSQREPRLVQQAGEYDSACLHPERTEAIVARILQPRAPASGTGPILTVSNLCKTYTKSGGFFRAASRIEALRHVSFELMVGEFLGVVGESGSGKSTLAKLVLGLERPTSGGIVLAGVDVSEDSSRTRRHRVRSIQMVFQDPQSALNPRRRVWQTVAQGLLASEPRPDKVAQLARADSMLAEIGMPPESGERYPNQLSGGQRQRVNIARALCVLPKILVADEIVSGLDVSVQAQLLELLLRLRELHNFSMILISHDLSVVRHLCDRVIVMKAGEIVETGRAREVLDAPGHSYTRALLAAVPPDSPHDHWAALEESAERVPAEEL